MSAFGTWGLLGIVSIVGALVGWSQQRETPMALYFWYLAATALFLAVAFVMMASSNSKCLSAFKELGKGGSSERLSSAPLSEVFKCF